MRTEARMSLADGGGSAKSDNAANVKLMTNIECRMSKE